MIGRVTTTTLAGLGSPPSVAIVVVSVVVSVVVPVVVPVVAAS